MLAVYAEANDLVIASSQKGQSARIANATKFSIVERQIRFNV